MVIYRVKVFLSWAGKNGRSFVVADGLNEWLPKVIHFADTFISSDDILVGQRWAGVLDTELAASDRDSVLDEAFTSLAVVAI